MTTPDDYCVDGDCSTGATCFRHKLRTIQFAPSAMPSRVNHVAPRTPQNSWEKGVPTDGRNMPFLDKNLNPIGQKEFVANRSTIERQMRDLKSKPTPTTTE